MVKFKYLMVRTNAAGFKEQIVITYPPNKLWKRDGWKCVKRWEDKEES